MIEENYTWEAERPNEIITKGGDISGCFRFSAIPKVPGLPRHDFEGLKFKNRFNRGFQKFPLFGYQEKLKRVKENADKQELAIIELTQVKIDLSVKKYRELRKQEPENVRGHADLKKDIAAVISDAENLVAKLFEKYFPSRYYFLCAVFDGGQIIVNCRDGAVSIKNENFELFV